MSLVQMTVSGGAFVLLIVVVRALALHRLPKGTFLALWEMAALRLLLPFTVPMPFSGLVPLRRLPAVGGSPAADAAPGSMAAELPAGLNPGGAKSLSLLPSVWLAGGLLMAAYFALCYIRARRRFRQSSPDNTSAVRRWLAGQRLRRPLEVRRSAQVASPLTYGVFRPVILLPEDMEREEEAALTYILTHEWVHIRRFDGLTKLVFAAVLCVHWFNPLVWAMYVLASRDLELSCDERVMNILGGGEKTSYALTLIAMEEARSRCFSPCNHFSKLAIEERIEAIMKYRKASVITLILAAALVVSATTAFAASEGEASGELLEGRPEAYTTASESSLMSYVNSQDGKTYYSFDGGQTFEPLTDEEFERRFPTPKVEWWTYEEYAAWMEKEKVALQAMLGEKGWTGGRGEFVWTQEVIDETIAMYENILQEIKAGKLYSKSVDGDTDIMLASGGDELLISDMGSGVFVKENGKLVEIDPSGVQDVTWVGPKDGDFQTAGGTFTMDKTDVRVHPVTGAAVKEDGAEDQTSDCCVICFDTQAELDEHLKALDANEAKGLDRYAGFEEMYAGIDPSTPVTYIVK